MQELRGELSSCYMDMEEVQAMTTFGVVTENECKFKLFDLKTNDPALMPLQANAFFELFIENANKQLVDVPVLIKNFRDRDQNSPNKDYDSEKSRLTHRFIIHDTISGIE